MIAILLKVSSISESYLYCLDGDTDIVAVWLYTCQAHATETSTNTHHISGFKPQVKVVKHGMDFGREGEHVPKVMDTVRRKESVSKIYKSKVLENGNNGGSAFNL